MRLSDKVAIITGGGSGIGREMCVLFASVGAKVVVADIDRHAAEETVDIIREQGKEARSVIVDVTDNALIEHMVAITLDQYGTIDILCNNAGIGGDLSLAAEASEAMWDRVIAVNLKSVFMISRRVIPEMLKRGGGVIINTASAAGLIASAAGCDYTASKHGVIGLTKQLAYEYGQQGIRVNAVCPGVIDTNHTAGMLGADGPFHDLTMRAPAGRYGKATEVATLALFLATDDASFMHGCAVPVEGGSTIY